MTTFTELFFKNTGVADAGQVVGAESVLMTTIPESSPKGDISNLRYMVSYAWYFKNLHATAGVSIKIDYSPEEVLPVWFPKQVYIDIPALTLLIVTGSEDLVAMKCTVKETVAATPSNLSTWLLIKQRR